MADRKARHHERLKVEVRASYPDEDSTIIEREALSRAPKSESVHPRAKFIVAVLNAVKTPQQVIVLLAFFGLLAYFVATAGPAIVERLF